MDTANAITELSEAQAWDHLATQSVGRLITSVNDVIDIVPINYVVDGTSLVFRTAPGTKLAELTINSSVLFEVDSIREEGGWSVVVRGTAAALESEAEILAAAELPLRPFVPTVKPVFVRIRPASLSARSFVFGEEPQREDVQEG